MEQEQATDLLIRSVAAYRQVVSNPEAAGPDVAHLIAEAREAGDRRALVASLRAEAWYARSRLAHERAAILLDEAVRIARRHQLHPQLREALTTRGAIRHEQGRMAAARRDLDLAASFVGADGDPELDSQRAALHQNTGRLAEAAAMYRRILTRPGTPPEVRTKAANNLGIIEVQRGRPEIGLAWFDEAADAAGRVGPAVVAIVAEGRAWATVRSGRLAEGIELFEASADLWKAAGLPLGELYAEYADALVDLRLIPEATREAQRAVQMLEAQGVALMAAEAQLRTAHLALLRGDPGTAREQAEAVAARLRGQGRTSWAARARLVAIEARLAAGSVRTIDLAAARRSVIALEASGIVADVVDANLTAGRVASTLMRHTEACSAWNKAAELSRSGSLLVRLKGRVAAALAAAAQDRPSAVLHHGRRGLADLARHRAALPSTELRVLASGHGAELGGLGLAAVARSRSPADVLGWMERTRAAALAVVDPPEVEGIEDELGMLRTVQADLAVERREGSAGVAELLAREAAIENQIRKATWRDHGAVDSPDRPRPIAELRAELAGQVLVEYDVLADNVVAVVLGPHRTRMVILGPLEPVRRQLRDLAFALRRLAQRERSAASLVAARGSAESAIAALEAQLVAPLDLRLPDGVVVVPVGELQRVPWAALHSVPVSVAPSAAMWARTHARRSPPHARVALVAGPGLPGALAEIEALADIHEDPEVLLPPQSDVASVTAALGRASLAHLACHGTVRSDNPMFSSLLVSDDSLTVHELDRRGIAPHRMVLAACESSSDVVYPGNEALGFVSTLLALGTSGVVASSVVIPDWNVVAVMTVLHSSIARGNTLAVALHDARMTIDRDDPAGFVSWCAFNAFGAA